MILYACVAAGPKILAEHDPTSCNATLAARCLHLTPKLHAFYTHTTQDRIYAFLIGNQEIQNDDDDSEEEEEAPTTFFAIAEESFGRSNTLGFLRRLRRCYRLRTHLDFSQLVLSATIPSSSLPKLMYTDEKDDDGGGGDGGVRDEMGIEVIDCERDSNGGLSLPSEKRLREETWKRNVRMVMLVDLLVCGFMFGVWLTVCKGFQCVKR